MNREREPIWQPRDLRDGLQRKCSDWGTYWRAPDSHGVIVSVEQATELLADAIGVEVEITKPANSDGLPYLSVTQELLLNIKRTCIRGRNVADMEQEKNFVATCDHIENLADQAIVAIQAATGEPQ